MSGPGALGGLGMRYHVFMWLRASCHIQLSIPVATPFILMLRPRSGDQQFIAGNREELSPRVASTEYTDSFGNLCQRLVAPPGRFTISSSVDAEASDTVDACPGAFFIPVQNLPELALPFLLPSRYCESDRFMQLAPQVSAGRAPGYDQCAAIVSYVRDTVRYTPETGQQIVSACEVNEQGHGVCRDLAHLCIACCRALSIPARMVVGYLEGLDPMDLHAWFEAYVGGRWYTFDPTDFNPSQGRIAIAYGRDAADVAIFTQFGDPVEVLDMRVSVERVSGLAGSPR